MNQRRGNEGSCRCNELAHKAGGAGESDESGVVGPRVI